MRFIGRFQLSEKRDATDSEPFFRLPRPRREAILQAGITQLETLLGMYFPEIKKEPKLLYVEFLYYRGGGSSIVAEYEAGRLSLSE